jgi:hypothetical protein
MFGLCRKQALQVEGKRAAILFVIVETGVQVTVSDKG